MDGTSDQPWVQSEQQLEQMATDLDDLGNLFEFGDIDLNNIPNMETPQFGDHLQQQQQYHTHPNTPFNEMSVPSPAANILAPGFGAHENFRMQNVGPQQHHQHQMQMENNVQMAGHPYPVDVMYQPVMHTGYPGSHAQHYPNQQQQQQQQQFPMGHQIPPTPNSYEMHGEAGRFLQQTQQMDPQQRAFLEQRYQPRKNDAVTYTPMVSPAGTPQFNVPPEFTTPGAYFSPLTSPMLHAQQNAPQHQLQQGYYTNPTTASSSNVTSPTVPNFNIDMNDGTPLPEPANLQARRSRRRTATPRSLGTGIKLKQSPTSKAQKRKSGALSSGVSVEQYGDLMAEVQRSARSEPGSAGLQMPPAFKTSSEEESVSPEPLGDAVMGPPPRPSSSLMPSPAIAAQHQQQQHHDAISGNASAAATPKSILSMRQQQAAHKTGSAADPATYMLPEALDDLQLPESAAKNVPPRPSLAQLDTSTTSSPSTQATPRISARKTPKLGPLSTPSSARPTSSTASPSVAASPMTAGTPAALLKDRKLDSKGGRGTKKRDSTGANGTSLVSPALRPRISPSIKPLLPEGTTLHSPTHALLLASKSNYQNILEGNHLPGVNYPDSLSTGLTSKRTSHKVAEQGRRNRINEALKEMNALIPKEKSVKGAGKDSSNSDASPDANGDAAEESKEQGEDAQAKSSNSKAATVESANVYIRRLQAENAGKTATLLALQREHAEMKARLLAERPRPKKEAAAEEEEEDQGDEMEIASPPPPTATAAASPGVTVQ